MIWDRNTRTVPCVTALTSSRSDAVLRVRQKLVPVSTDYRNIVKLIISTEMLSQMGWPYSTNGGEEECV
jgi:hypothetical protein